MVFSIVGLFFSKISFNWYTTQYVTANKIHSLILFFLTDFFKELFHSILNFIYYTWALNSILKIWTITPGHMRHIPRTSNFYPQFKKQKKKTWKRKNQFVIYNGEGKNSSTVTIPECLLLLTYFQTFLNRHILSLDDMCQLASLWDWRRSAKNFGAIRTPELSVHHCLFGNFFVSQFDDTFPITCWI